MRIRKMKKEDLKYVNAMFLYGEGINERTLKSKYVYVAVEKDVIIGMLFADASKCGTCILFSLEVIKNHRNKGIATKLIYRFEKDAKKGNVNTIFVFYNKEEKLKTFYEKFNFEMGSNLDVACKPLI